MSAEDGEEAAADADAAPSDELAEPVTLGSDEGIDDAGDEGEEGEEDETAENEENRDPDDTRVMNGMGAIGLFHPVPPSTGPPSFSSPK